MLPSHIRGGGLARGGGHGFVIVVVVLEERGGRNTGGEVDTAAGLIDAFQLANIDAEMVHDGIGALKDQRGGSLLACQQPNGLCGDEDVMVLVM